MAAQRPDDDERMSRCDIVMCLLVAAAIVACIAFGLHV